MQNMPEMADNALPSGTMLGQYKLEQATAQGGFGVLYRAWDTRMNRRVAIKECFPASLCHRDAATGQVRPHSESLRPLYEAALNDVFEEAHTISGLHHANVIQVYDIFRAAGSIFYVMPWMDGGSLRDKMQAGESISERRAVEWLMGILKALEYLHNKKIIHRDIKPGNIMFDGDSNPVLVDFGAALNRATKVDTTTQGDFSPVYASPEQVSGKGKIGPWTDLYSLAATWYELLSGKQPEPAQQRLLQDDLVPLTTGASVLQKSIMQNLMLQATNRCQSAREWDAWLLAGREPKAVARNRNTRLLYTVPLVLLSIGAAFYLGTHNKGALPQTPTQPEPNENVTPTPAFDKEAFAEQIIQQLNIENMLMQQEAFCRQLEDLENGFYRKVDDLVVRLQSCTDADTRKEIHAEYHALVEETTSELSALAYDGSALCAKLGQCINHPWVCVPSADNDTMVKIYQVAPLLREKYLKEADIFNGKYISSEPRISSYKNQYFSTIPDNER